MNEMQPIAMPGVTVTCLWPGPSALGECPIWDHRCGRLYWIDSLGRRIWFREAGGAVDGWDLPGTIGSIGLCRGGGLIAAVDNRVGRVDGVTGAFVAQSDPLPLGPGLRLNDGKVDRAGRFWCGSMNTGFDAATAELFRFEADLSWQRVDGGFVVSNGIAISPDDRTFYFSDSRSDRSFAYDFDLATGELTNRRAFVRTAAYAGRIDGATVDRDGNYWGALFDGWAVGCFDPGGRLLRRIELPVRCPTMCAWGGAGLDRLYVTSATFLLSEEEQASQPLAGGLFEITGLGSTGLPEPEFGADGSGAGTVP